VPSVGGVAMLMPVIGTTETSFAVTGMVTACPASTVAASFAATGGALVTSTV
jgi:nucleoside recognition membrane protein YjiH